MRDTLPDLLAFIAIAREGSFTRAAAKLGVSQSALSRTMMALERRMGVRLLTRTTRSVSPTEAGERLLRNVGPRLDEIEAELQAVSELRERPAGTIRITATDHGAERYLWPRLTPLLARYPELKIEVVVDYGLVDIVAQRFDMGVRFGDQVEKDMVAVRIGPDVEMALVATPDYFERRPRPRTPRDLLAHDCINLRLSAGGLYAWELRKGRQALQVRVDGQATCNSVYQIRHVARAGGGLGFVPRDMVEADLASGRLVGVMRDWCPTFPGLHVFFPSRRASLRALRVIVDTLRFPPRDDAAIDAPVA